MDWRKRVEQAAAAVLGGTSAVEVISRDIATFANAKLVIEQFLSRWGHTVNMLSVSETDEGTRIERSPEWRGIGPS